MSEPPAGPGGAPDDAAPGRPPGDATAGVPGDGLRDAAGGGPGDVVGGGPGDVPGNVHGEPPGRASGAEPGAVPGSVTGAAAASTPVAGPVTGGGVVGGHAAGGAEAGGPVAATPIVAAPDADAAALAMSGTGADGSAAAASVAGGAAAVVPPGTSVSRAGRPAVPPPAVVASLRRFVAWGGRLPAGTSPARAGLLGRVAALRGWRADGTAFGLGVLAALALPPFGVVPLLLVCLPGLFVLAENARSPGVALRRGFLFGFGHHLLGFHWITQAILIMAARFWWFVPLAVPMTAAGMAVFIALPCAAVRMARPGWRRVLFFAGSWTLFDVARQFALTGFPWNPLGSVWELPGRLGDAMIQPAAAMGVHGLTLLTVLLALSPVLGRRWVAGAGAVLLLWVTGGATRLLSPAPPPQPLEALLVQGNIAEGAKQDHDTAVATFLHYLDLTRAAVAAARAGMGAGAVPLVVVWPETAFPGLLDQDPGARLAIAAAARPAVAALVGSVRFDADGHPRNSLMAVLPDGTVGATYDKAHLVPAGEYSPSWLPFVQVVPGGGFAAGPGPRTQHVPGLPSYGVAICYETIFPAQVVDQSDRPLWLLEVTNDAWFGNGSGPREHLAAGRMRAVEEGLPLLRAANTGITAAFDARGHELARLPLDVSGSLPVRLPGALPSTPFARLGLSVPLLLGFLCCAFGLGLGRRRAAESVVRS